MSKQPDDHDKPQNDRDESDRSDDDKQSDSASEDTNEEQRGSILEKIFTVLSTLLLLFLVGFLVVQIFREDSPPSFDVHTSVARVRGDFIAVAVIIKNTGDDPAKAVQVRGEAPGADGKPVEGEATLDWLPGKSQRHVTLLFPPGTGLDQLEASVVGYEEP